MKTTDHEPAAPARRAAAALAIQSAVLQAIHAAARSTATETMGLLASPPGGAGIHPVTAARPLPAASSPCSAEACPQAIAEACAELAAAGLIPRGLYHSHPAGVQESAIDQASLRRIAPSIAGHAWERPVPRAQAPTVSGPARALLPDADTTLAFTLRGRHVPQLGAYEPARWAGVTIDFDASRQQPEAILTRHRLTLCSAGVQVALELPQAASVVSATIDAPGSRFAHVYSLIVNRCGGQQARAVAVLDADGRTLCEPVPCEIIVLDGCTPRPGTPPSPGPGAGVLMSRP